MTQSKLIEEEEEESGDSKRDLEKFIKKGLTEKDKKREAIRTEVRYPRWIQDILQVIARRSRLSVNKVAYMTIKRGVMDLREIEREYTSTEMRAILKQIAYCMAELEGEFILDCIEARKIRISNGGMAGRTVTIIWWVHGILTEMAEDLGVSLNDLIIVATCAALLSFRKITERQKENMIRTLERFHSMIEQNWLICDAVMRYLPVLKDRSIERDKKTERELNEKIQEIQERHPDLYFRYFKIKDGKQNRRTEKGRKSKEEVLEGSR